jgi:hypothetical protein
MRRPIFIYDKNKVGGGEHLFLRRAESAKRLGLAPVVITIPGAMDEAYLKVARLIHLPKPLLSKCGLTPALGEGVADQLVGRLGSEPSSIEATGMPSLYLASLLSHRLPSSDHLFFAIGPRPAPRHRPPAFRDAFSRPGEFGRALLGRSYYHELADLAARGRFLSVNQPCASDAERQLGRPMPGVLVETVTFSPAPAASAERAPSSPFVLSVSRLDGGMKAYVEGLIREFPRLVALKPGLRLVIVGDGPAMPMLRRLADTLAVGMVDFLGTLPNEKLSPLYAGCEVFVGMGTAAVEAAMHGAPVVIAVESEPRCLSPGIWGDPELVGFGEAVPGQRLRPLFEMAAPLLQDRTAAKLLSERGRARSDALHGPARLDERMRALLSSPASRGQTLPCPWPEPHWLAWNILSGYPWRKVPAEITRT